MVKFILFRIFYSYGLVRLSQLFFFLLLSLYFMLFITYMKLNDPNTTFTLQINAIVF